MPQTLTESLDNLWTTTWENRKSKVQDNIYDSTPFWFWLRDKGGIESVEGGRFLEEPLLFAKSDNVKFIQKGGTVSLADKEFLTAALFDWRYLVDSIVRFFIDEQKNRGKNAIFKLMKAKMDNSEYSLIDKIEQVLFEVNPDDNGIGFHALTEIIPDDPTTGTFGGIDSAANDWWRNQTIDMAGQAFSTFGRKRMTTMLNNCGQNRRMDRPDLIMSGQSLAEYYEDLTIAQKRISNQKLGDAGFENIEFKGLPIVWSPSCSNERMYFLNTRFLKFQRDPNANFDMTEWKAIPDQVNDRAAQVILAGNLTTGRRRVHGVIHSVDTP